MIVPSKPKLLLLTNPLDAPRLASAFQPFFEVTVAFSVEQALSILQADLSINCVLAAISTNLWQITGVAASLEIVQQLDRSPLAWAALTSDRYVYTAEQLQQCGTHNIEVFNAGSEADGVRLEDWAGRAATLARPAQGEG